MLAGRVRDRVRDRVAKVGGVRDRVGDRVAKVGGVGDRVRDRVRDRVTKGGYDLGWGYDLGCTPT